jgi:LAS superfamily LD-carboxypeptidase LdcB
MTARMAQIEGVFSSINSVRAAARPAAATPAQAGTATATSFADALKGALATNATNASSTETTRGSGRLNADGVPVDLARFGNGKITKSELSQVGQTDHRLWAPAASSLDSLLAAAGRDGVKIGITDSYRSFAEQVDLARRKGLYSQGGLAAKPGTSDHGWGLAVDLDLNGKAQAWMRSNAGRFGFAEDTPREPWHWAFKPKS